jgi:hypothetical protein
MGAQENNMWLKVDGRATDAEMLGGFGDSVLFSHASSISQLFSFFPLSRFGTAV